MSPVLVFLSYGTAFILALFLLWHFHAKPWYWHVLSLAVAAAIGLTPLPEPFRGPGCDAFVGTIFVFLFFWGVAAPFFHAAHHHR